ncbi:MAG: hypothetical protein OXU74_00365 [Gemmatimonadota bacterium]|nr:hypothetical protein [Gemmatimonadota bacterium]
MTTHRRKVTDTHEPVVIRRRVEETETDYLLRSPANAKRLREAMAWADSGEGGPRT